MTQKKIITIKGCDTCNTAKKAGMCKDNKCIDVNSKKGKKIEKQANVKLFPQCVVQKKDGTWKKCNVEPYLKKYLKK